MRPGGGVSFTPKKLTNIRQWVDGSNASSLYSDAVFPDQLGEYEINAQLQPIVWVAADHAFVTPNGSGQLTFFQDKSLSANIFQNSDANPATRPTLVQNVINGKPVIRFSGGQYIQALLTASTVFSEMFAVMRIRNAGTSGRGTAIDYVDGDGYSVTLSSTAGSKTQMVMFDDYAGVDQCAVDGFDSFSLVSLYYDPGSSAALVSRNYSAQSTSGTSGYHNGGDQICLGKYHAITGGPHTTDEYFNGDIAEIICFMDILTAGQRAGVEAYLASKYNIPSVHSRVSADILPVSSPLAIGGCIAWYDGADASTMFNATSGGTNSLTAGSIARWEDKSPSKYHCDQLSPSSRPTLVTSQLNGKSVVRFDGGDGLNAALPASFPYHSYTAFAVVKLASNVTYQRVLAFAASSGNDYDSGSVIPICQGASSTGTLATFSYPTGTNYAVVPGYNNTYGIFSSVNSFGTLNNYTNGGLVATASASGLTMTNTAGRMAIGQPPQGGAGGLDGDIAELIVYQGALRTGERQRIEQYLSQKWGIAVTPPSPQVGRIEDSAGGLLYAYQSVPSSAPLLAKDSSTGRTTLDMTSGNRNYSTTLSIGTAIGTATTTPTTMFAASWKPTANNAGLTFGSSPVINSLSRVYFHSDYGSAPNHIFDIGSVPQGRVNATVTDETLANTITVCYRNGSEMIVRRNGAQILANYSASLAFSSTSGYLSLGVVDGPSYSQCYLNEFLCCSTVPTLAEIVKLEKYLAKKWGVTLAPSVANADARDWIGRVYAAGGSVSQSTANAVNTFCNAIDAESGLRATFIRCNLYCGNSDASLIAVRTPLYRGTSRSATQYGSTLDSNNLFATTDYSELTGLQGDGSTKWMSTGVPGNTVATGNRHLSVYEIVRDTTAYRAFIGMQDDSGGTYYFTLGNNSPGTSVFASFGAQASYANTGGGGHWIASDTSGPLSLVLYKNGASVASSSATLRQTPNTNPIAVFGSQNSAAAPATVGALNAGRFGGYSIGTGMTAPQALAYYNAMQAFQTALGRSV